VLSSGPDLARSFLLFCAVLLSAFPCSGQESSLQARLNRALAGSSDATTAEDLFRKHDFAGVRNILQRRPPSPELSALQGAVAFVGGDMTGAIESFRKAELSGALRTEDRFTFSMALVRAGQSQKARQLLQALATQAPRTALYPYWLGRIDYDEHRYVEAAGELKQSLAIDPRFVRAWNALGLTFDMQGQTTEATSTLAKAAELNRSQPAPSPWPPHDYGFLLLRSEQLSEAERNLRESLQYDPAFSPGHYHLGRVLEKQGKNEEAIAEYRQAMGEDEQVTDACYSLALLLKKLGREADAAATFAEYRKRKDALAPARDSGPAPPINH
jgi:tetratricopeptide (TPR) repeat protein